MGCMLVKKTFIQNQHEYSTELHTNIYFTMVIIKSPPTLWWWRLIVFAESARRRRHLFLLSLEKPYSDYFQIFEICILALGNLAGNFFFCVLQFLQQNPRWPPKSYGAR